jgi:hypothetical protein
MHLFARAEILTFSPQTAMKHVFQTPTIYNYGHSAHHVPHGPMDWWTGGEFIRWVEYIGNGGMFVSIRSTGGGYRSE